ncbi:MAG TPA: 5'-3' exonuclease H3TH domain-containing protein [Chthoniobacterales bacterium]
MRLLLVDGHYYLYRSFFAIRGLSNSRGEPTNAIYGYTKALRKMLGDVKPDRVGVVWDRGLPARRVELQPAYKQNRAEMPEDLRRQEDPVRRLCECLGLMNLSLPDTEADDLIASYALAAHREGAEVFIATSDKDIQQLVRPGLSIYATVKSAAGFALLGPEEIRERWGVEPARIADVLCLTGDSSDNIPGVNGVGEKTAAALIRQFGSVGELLQRPEEIANGKQRERVLAARDLIRDNREMVRLDDDLPLPVPWLDLEIRRKDQALVAFLRECEFKSLLAEVERETGLGSAPPAQPELFA